MSPKDPRWTIWTPELLALVSASLSLVAIVVLLSVFDGKSIFTWYGVTLNAVVSILSLVLKSNLAYVLAECTAQWKWILFATQSRPLIDFDRVDAAVMGPLGALRVLTKMKGKM